MFSNFPFVRGVMISGSLSKGSMSPDSDVDYFIITAPNRLWIARTLLMTFKKLFLFNSRKFFCLNYFVDTNHLEIEEKNIFTATELATLLPVQGIAHYHALISKNLWLLNFLPNSVFEKVETKTQRTPALKTLLENILQGWFGNQMDILFQKIHEHYWRMRFSKKLSAEEFKIALKSKRGISKGHPNNYQDKVLNKYGHACEALATKTAQLASA